MNSSACLPEVALNASHFHGLHHHARQAEGHLCSINRTGLLINKCLYVCVCACMSVLVVLVEELEESNIVGVAAIHTTSVTVVLDESV